MESEGGGAQLEYQLSRIALQNQAGWDAAEEGALLSIRCCRFDSGLRREVWRHELRRSARNGKFSPGDFYEKAMTDDR